MIIRHSQGFTLVELVVAITLVGIAGSTILGLLSVIAMRSSEALFMHQATNIATAYLHEITSKPFGVSMACSGSSPPRDDVCDYEGIDEMGARDQSGTPIAGLGAYRVQVAVNNAALGGVPARLIVVTVTDPLAQPTVISSYKVQ